MLDSFVQGTLEQLKDDAKIVSEDKVVFHFYQMLLFKISPVLVIIELLQYLYFNHSLQNKLSLVLYDFDRVLRSLFDIDAFHNLAKGSLAQVLDNFVLFILR